MRRSLLKLNERHLPKALRQALVLITLLLLPSAAWGQTVTVTKTITFNKEVATVSGDAIDNSTIPVSVSEEIGGTPYTYNSNVYIKDDNAIEQYSSSKQGGAVFKVNNDATSDLSSIIIIIPGNYPIVPTMVKLKFKYANAIGDTEYPDDDYNAIIHVCDYTTGDTPDLRYKTTESNLDKTTNPLIFTAEGKPVTVGGETITGEGGTDRKDGPKSLWIMAYLDGNPEAEEEERTTFTITEVEITYDINESDVYGLTVAGVPVTNVNASAVLFDKENWGGNYEEVKGTVSFTPAGTNPATLTLNGATISGGIFTTLDNLTIELTENSSINAAATTTINGIASSKNTGTLTFTGSGSLEIASGCSVIRGFSELSLSSGLYSQSDPYEIYENSGYKRLRKFTGSDADTTAITSFAISTAATYPLWVGGTQITAANAENISSGSFSGTEYKVSFTSGTTNTLKLKGVTINMGTNNVPAIISGLGNLTVELEGGNSIDYNNDGNHLISSINSSAALTFKASGTNVVLSSNLGSTTYTDAPASGFSGITYDGDLVYVPGTGVQYVFDMKAPTISTTGEMTANTFGGYGTDFFSIYYTIDYEDETPDITTPVLYENNLTVSHPCTVTAYAKFTNGSDTKNGPNGYAKYFSFEETYERVYDGQEELTVAELPALVPAVAESDGVTYSISESSNTSVINQSEGKWIVNGMGETSLSITPEASTSTPYTVLGCTDLNVKSVPTAPEITLARGTYMTGTAVTILPVVNLNTIKYKWSGDDTEYVYNTTTPPTLPSGTKTLTAWNEYTPEGNTTALKSEEVTAEYTAGDYAFIIAGHSVESGTSASVSGEGITGTVSYDGTSTLTLSGATITGNIQSNISPLTVHLIGSSTINAGDDIAPFEYKGTGTGTGSLTFESSEEDDGELTLGGSFDTEGDSPEISLFTGDYTATNKFDTGNGPSFGDWIINSSKIFYNPHYGITVGNYEVTKKNKDMVTDLSGSYITYSPSDNILKIPANQSFSNTEIKSYRADLNIQISGTCFLKAISFEQKTEFTATSGTLTIKKDPGSTADYNRLTITNSDGGVITGFTSVTIEEPMQLLEPEATPTWNASVHEAIFTDETLYDLWVEGQRVTSGNKDNVKEEYSTDASYVPSVKYDATNETLTLYRANITVSDKNAIESGLANLTVKLLNGTSESSGGVLVNSISCGDGFYAFKGVGSDNAITFITDTDTPGSLEITGGSPISGLTAEYKNGLGLLSSSQYSIETLSTPELKSSENTDGGINVALILPSGDSYSGATMYYSITYADEEVEETAYSNAFTMTKPGTVTAYLKPSLGGQSKNEIGKYYGYPDAPYTLGTGDELSPTIYPAILEEEYIGFYDEGYSSNNEAIATFTEGEITAKEAGTATLTATLSGSDMAFTVLNPYDQTNTSHYPITFTVIVGENLNNMFAEGQSYGTYYNTSTTTYKVPEGLTAYVVTGVDEDKVTVTDTKVIPPNTPILLERSDKAKAFTYTEATDADGTLPSGNILKYTTTDKDAVEASKLYVLYNGQFVKVTAGTKILANHCYLDLSGTTAGTRGFYNIGNGEGTTAIREVKNGEVNSEKWGNGEWFDLQGRRLSAKPNKSGLYILNGKKIVIK